MFLVSKRLGIFPENLRQSSYISETFRNIRVFLEQLLENRRKVVGNILNIVENVDISVSV